MYLLGSQGTFTLKVAIKTLYGYDLDMTDPETHERKTLKVRILHCIVVNEPDPFTSPRLATLA